MHDFYFKRERKSEDKEIEERCIWAGPREA